MKTIIALAILLTICGIAFAGWVGQTDDSGTTHWENGYGNSMSCQTFDDGTTFCG